MARAPEFVKGLVFGEPFFDTIIRNAGGHRLLDLHTPPPHTQNVDYLIGGFALELKILTQDVLDAPERQAKLAEFIKTEFPKGPLWVTANRREASFKGVLQKDYWEKYLGKPIQDRLDSAADQIVDTRTFVPGPLRGGVLIVNAGGHSLDWQSFSHLANHYGLRFPSIDAIFAMSAVPNQIEGGFQFHFATMGKEGHRTEADQIGTLLNDAIVAEISKRTAKNCLSTEVDAHAPSPKITFTYTEKGMRRKMPQPQKSNE